MVKQATTFLGLSKTLQEKFDSFLEKRGLNDVGVLEEPDSDEEHRMETSHKVVGSESNSDS